MKATKFQRPLGSRKGQGYLPRMAGRRGVSLIELLASMTILSVLLLMLAQTLDLSLDQWRQGSGGSAMRGELRAAMSWLERDLHAAVIDRPANVPPLSASATEVEREFFADRLIMPIEINRTEETGDGNKERTFVNAAAEFDSLAFVTQTPLSSQVNVERDQARLGLGDAAVLENASSWDGLSSACLTGYYVAWTKNSPLASERESSMKLFRHFRPGGESLGQGQSQGFLRAMSNVLNDDDDESAIGSARASGKRSAALIRNGVFENSRIPFLFATRVSGGAAASLERSNDQPWPVDAEPASLTSPPSQFQPPSVSWQAWGDPDSALHDYLFADEALAYNVVLFECRPYRKIIGDDGAVRLMDAQQLSAHLGLAGEQWPVLVAPSFIDVRIGVASRLAASQMQERGDWIIDWSQTDPGSWSVVRRVVERNLQVYTTRIFLHSAP